MKIPVGNFGFSTPEPAAAPDLTPVSAAVDRLGRVVSSIGARSDEKDQELARAQDVTAYQNHSLAVDHLKVDTAAKISSGEIPYTSAGKYFQEEAAKIPAPKPMARGPVAAEALQRGTQYNIAKAGEELGRVADAAKDKDLQSQGALQLDTLGKRAGLPGADIEGINSQADAIAPVLRSGGLSEAQVSRTIQNFKDANWFNQATTTAMQARQSLPALKQLETDLTAADGYYAGKLDTDKRNAVLSQVIGHRIQLENHLTALQDKREAKAERAVNEMDRQIASGVPATADQWETWRGITAGTTVAGDFKDRQADEQHVQQVLRQPIADQIKYVQDKTAELDTNGGSVREATNLAHLTTAVKKNVSLMQTDPLLFQANRTGQEVKPLDFGGLVKDDGGAFAAQLADRAASISAMRKQYGAQVPQKLLLPEEAAELGTAISHANATDASHMFGALRNAVGDDKLYQATVQQIAPDSPVKALAGLLAARPRTATLATHWFKADETIDSAKAAATILEGQDILSPSKGEKAADGRPKLQLYLPEEKSLQDAFQSQVGTAFADRPNAAQDAFQAVKAYYVGRASQKGRLAANATDIDTGIVKEAVKGILGNVVDVNGRGDVIAPWGMPASDFTSAARASLEGQASRINWPAGIPLPFDKLGLKAAGANSYYVTAGRSYLQDKHGEPVVLNLAQAAAP